MSIASLRTRATVPAYLACLVVLAVGLRAQAGVVVVAPPADLVPAALPQTTTLVTPLVDVNGDGAGDFVVTFTQPQEPSGLDWNAQIGVRQARVSVVAQQPEPFLFVAQRFNTGDAIGPVTPAGSAYTPNDPAFPNFETFAFLAQRRTSGSQFGQFLPPDSHGFVGLRFNTPSGPLYGYLEMNVTRSPGAGQPGVDFVSLAYESIPNVPIIAGAIPEPAGLGALVIGAGALLARRRTKTD